jgi:hypothetical protein
MVLFPDVERTPLRQALAAALAERG